MANDPIQNPGVTPTPKVPQYGQDQPRLGAGEEAQEPKPFSLPPEGKQGAAPTESTAAGRPSPLDMARDESQKQAQMTPQELGSQVNQLKDQLGDIKTKLQSPELTKNFTEDHYTAIGKVTEKMNPDMKTIAKTTGTEFNPPTPKKGKDVVSYAANWINGSQQTLNNALVYLQNTKQPDMSTFLRLQYSVQRSVQRGELFSSIIGSSVSGIKTIMSTQLG